MAAVWQNNIPYSVKSRRETVNDWHLNSTLAQKLYHELHQSDYQKIQSIFKFASVKLSTVNDSVPTLRLYVSIQRPRSSSFRARQILHGYYLVLASFYLLVGEIVASSTAGQKSPKRSPGLRHEDQNLCPLPIAHHTTLARYEPEGTPLEDSCGDAPYFRRSSGYAKVLSAYHI